jgi:hypothetical protein
MPPLGPNWDNTIDQNKRFQWFHKILRSSSKRIIRVIVQSLVIRCPPRPMVDTLSGKWEGIVISGLNSIVLWWASPLLVLFCLFSPTHPPPFYLPLPLPFLVQDHSFVFQTAMPWRMSTPIGLLTCLIQLDCYHKWVPCDAKFCTINSPILQLHFFSHPFLREPINGNSISYVKCKGLLWWNIHEALV